MKKTRSIVGIAVGVSSLVLAAAGVVSYRAVEQLANTSDDLLRAKELELSLERLLSTLRDAETGQRGFLLSGGEEGYLAPYHEALRELDNRLVTVEIRTQDRDGTTAQLETLRVLMDRKLGEIASTLDLYREGRREAALALVRSDEGKVTMDAIRAFVGRRVQVEQSNVERLFETQDDALRDTVRSSVAVIVLAILLLLLLGWVVKRDSARVRESEERLIAADRRKDEFLAMLAHELRNPLAPIRQSVRIATNENVTPEQRRWSLGVIERQAAHMARLLDDLLDVSRITRGRLEIRRSRAALSAIVETAVETARPAIDAGQHALRVELPAESPVLEVDPLRMAQVIGNLLTNAAKYTPKGGEIQLVAERRAGEVLIRVIDNGIGLRAEDLPQIFGMFSQVTPTPDRKDGGLGIGLALARALVELHGGRIEARSAGPGQGSEFSVRLAHSPA
jgi:signal transduction histidine kinase